MSLIDEYLRDRREACNVLRALLNQIETTKNVPEQMRLLQEMQRYFPKLIRAIMYIHNTQLEPPPNAS